MPFTNHRTHNDVSNAKYSVLGTRILSWLATITLILASALATPAHAQNPNETASAVEEPTPEKETVRPTLDLGKFKIHDLRPTRNETAKVTFKLHLAFSKRLTEKQVAQLERWQHRLRDQVIIAVRTLSVKEFQEPDLSRLRRKILIRVNRLLKAKLAEEVLLTEYLFRTQ